MPSAWACCGRTLYDFGMLDLAKRWLRRLIAVLAPWAAEEIPVVVPEPSCLAAFRDELPALLPGNPRAARLASLARSPAEHLVKAGHLGRLEASAPGQGRRAVLHPHCHQRAVIGTGADQAVLQAAGFTVDVLDAGCCGLAGSFGFDARHEPVSRQIGEDLWLPKVRAALSAGTLAAGTVGAGTVGAGTVAGGPVAAGTVGAGTVAGGPVAGGPVAGGPMSRGTAAGGAASGLAADAGQSYLVVDGFSCRAQLEHLGPDLVKRTTTLAALVRSRLVAAQR